MNLKNLLARENRVIFISICVILMASMIIVIGQSIVQSERQAITTPMSVPSQPMLPAESGVFRLADQSLYYLESVKEQGTRTLSVFYQRRAFNGAPPVIPHEVTDEASFGGNTCLQCHEHGGFVPKFNTYAPVTPHPELISCRQCHVPIHTQNLFKPTGWRTVAPPMINRSAMAGSPPQIPHGLQMRENCLACHGGPGSVKEIRTPHPDRANCRQCHGIVEKNEVWVRPMASENK
ncbi:nitrate reductase cytochrome c-type subunit [bacterium]|nr:nitrate reductase cytochrome c-type subunit [bacterium]